MTPEQITTIVTNALTGSGIVALLWMIIRGLKKQILSLNEVINTQKKTLETMETRVLETEKVGNIYRKFIEELPEDIEKYKAVLRKLKDDTILELERANQQKDEKLKSNAEIALEKLELQQRALEELPQLRDELIDVINSVNYRLNTVNQLSHIQSRGFLGGLITGGWPILLDRTQPLLFENNDDDPNGKEEE